MYTKLYHVLKSEFVPEFVPEIVWINCCATQLTFRFHLRSERTCKYIISNILTNCDHVYII